MIKKHIENPLIRPCSVKPSRQGYRVKGSFNAGATEFNDEIILLLRVAEDCVGGEDTIPYPITDLILTEGIPKSWRKEPMTLIFG